MHNLFPVLFFAMVLSSASNQFYVDDLCPDAHKGPCKRSSQCEPFITPSNSTHLLVNWEDVFKGCQKEHIERMEVEISKGKSKMKINISVSQDSATIKADPCLQHDIVITMIMTKNYSDTYGRGVIRTPTFRYNSRKSMNYPFGGLLATQVLPKICLKKNGTITVPAPPEALHNCGLTTGDVRDSDFEEAGKTAAIRIWYNSPSKPTKRTSKLFEVHNIQVCQSTSLNTTTTILIIATCTTSAIALITSTCLVMFCCKRWLKKSKGKRIEKQDRNNIYGLYYTEDGQKIDHGNVEVMDVNDYYG